MLGLWMAAQAQQAPVRPSPPLTPAALSARASIYESGAQTRRTSRWTPPTTSPNSNLGTLATIRARSRAAVRNDGFAKAPIDALVANVVGTGIKPQSLAGKNLPELPHPISRELVPAREALDALFLLWTDESDADGQLDFYGQQAQAVRCTLDGGDSYTRMRPRLPNDGLTVPLQLQVLEPELSPYHHSTTLPNGHVVRAGIEMNAIGQRVAYWFHPTRPSPFEDFDASRLVRVPADAVIHLYDPLRAGQMRGNPRLTPALVRLWELDQFDDATLVRQKIANLFAGFIERSGSPAGAENIDPLTGQTQETDADGTQMVSLEPGLLQELEPGEKVEFSDPPDMQAGYADFMRQQLIGASAAHGVPYEVVTGDMSKVNDRTVRVILQEFRRRVQAWQHQIVVFQFCRRVWNAWMDRVFLSGALPIPIGYLDDPRPWRAVRWMPQGWQYLHPVQDVQANKEAVRCGFRSRAAVVSELGDDVEQIDDEQAADNERADELGLRYDSDGRTKAAAAAPPAPPDPDRDPEQQPEGAPA